MRKVFVLFSGGVDSTVAVLETLRVYPKEEITMVWEDTGAEYYETEAHVKSIADSVNLPLVILKPPLDYWDLIRHTGYFPRPQYRFCTSRLKERVFLKWIRGQRDGIEDEIIAVSGIRSDESRSRSKMEPFGEIRKGVFRWLPCFDMSKNEVRERVTAEGLCLHPCYDFATRLSCWCCIFAHPNEVRPYAEAHPELYEKACLIEDEIKDKWKWRYGFNDLMKQGRLFDAISPKGCAGGLY